MDFFHRERYEMYTMSTATEIANNVWLGPTPDPTLDGSSENQSDRPEFDILIGCHDGAAMPRGVHFKLAERQLEQRESCSSSDKDNVVDDLEFPASGAILPPTWGNDEVGRLLDTCRWIHNQANRRSLKRRRDSKFSAGRDRPFSSSSSDVPDADGDRPMTASQDNIKDNQSSGRQVLIHCYDGYTESSLLALAYYMFAHGVRVHDAWLQLHRERGRNFFAYPSDVQLLRVVEHCILFASPACKPNNSTSVPSSPCASPSLSDTTSPPLTPFGTSSFSADAATTNDRVSKCVSSVNQRLSAIPSYTSSPTPAWLDKMDGSLPSRILPYMYLGNLAHANNPSLLKAMGIGQVLSVGENINWTRLVTPTEDEASDDDEHGQENGEYNGWLRESLRFVDGVQDNGVDPLMEELVKCLDFIGESSSSFFQLPFSNCAIVSSRCTLPFTSSARLHAVSSSSGVFQARTCDKKYLYSFDLSRTFRYCLQVCQCCRVCIVSLAVANLALDWAISLLPLFALPLTLCLFVLLPVLFCSPPLHSKSHHLFRKLSWEGSWRWVCFPLA
jgi:dual specificity MAP kinase phosphatase